MADDITPIDSLTFVRANPRMFFRAEPNPLDSLNHIVGDAVLGGFECTVFRLDDWWVVRSCDDWLAGSKRDPRDLFFQVVAAPEKGINAMRYEILLTAFAAEVWTFDGDWWKIHGTGSLPNLVRTRAEKDARRAIAFRWPWN